MVFCLLAPASLFSSNSSVMYENQIAVLLYHDFHPAEKDLSISPQRFEEHLKMLKEHSFNVVSMDQLVDFMLHDKKLPPNAVLITFDDGYEDFYTVAYPILKKYKMVASNFIIVSATEKNTLNTNTLPHLTWDQMRDMKQNGMGFYSHTFNLHYFLDNDKTKPILVTVRQDETMEQYKERIKKDFTIAQRRLDEELGDNSKIISFPYGAYNKTIKKIGEELGISLFFTNKEGINDETTNEIFRINAGRKDISASKLMDIIKEKINDRQKCPFGIAYVHWVQYILGYQDAVADVFAWVAEWEKRVRIRVAVVHSRCPCPYRVELSFADNVLPMLL